jgi:hypothetical protein
LDLFSDEFSTIFLGEFLSPSKGGRKQEPMEGVEPGKEWLKKASTSFILSGPGF